MIWKQKQFNGWKEIAKTGFLVSLASYILFWLMDLVQPGFVSRYFSVHIFLLTGFVFGVWWSALIDEYVEHAWIQGLIALSSGLIVAVLIWGSTDGLEGYQLPITLMSFFVPWLMFRILKS